MIKRFSNINVPGNNKNVIIAPLPNPIAALLNASIIVISFKIKKAKIIKKLMIPTNAPTKKYRDRLRTSIIKYIPI